MIITKGKSVRVTAIPEDDEDEKKDKISKLMIKQSKSCMTC